LPVGTDRPRSIAWHSRPMAHRC